MVCSLCKKELLNVKYDLCEECMALLEEASIRSAENMGAPEWYGCGNCGEVVYPADIFKHFPCKD